MDDRHDTAESRPSTASLVAEAAVLFVVLRVGLSLLGAFMATQGAPAPCHYEEAFAGWQTMPERLGAGPAFPLAGVWERFDACWYMKIATYGYEPGEDSVAFFPLFPSLVRVVGVATTLPYPVSGLVVSSLAYVVAIVGLLRLVGDVLGYALARRSALLLSVFPTAFFLFAPFTESLFLAAALWTLVLARDRRWVLVAGCAAIAALSRPQGILLAIPLAWEAFIAVRAHPLRLETLAAGLAALAPVAAFLGYLAAVGWSVGQTPVDAQAVWGGTQFHPPWAVVAASWGWIAERGDGMQAINLLALIGSTGILLYGVRKLPITWSLYAWPPLLLLASRIQPTPLTSTSRYVLVIFPIFVVAALLTENRRPAIGWLVISTLLLGLLATMFLEGKFVA